MLQAVTIQGQDVQLQGDLTVPTQARGLVLFAHGSGSSRHSSRNRHVARVLNDGRLATLLMDLLTEDEEAMDAQTAEFRFDIPLLANRLILAVDWIAQQDDVNAMGLGCFGASTGAAAALVAAAERPDRIRAVVSRGGRPDLAGDSLRRVLTPSLFIVGGHDSTVLDLNRQAIALLPAKTERTLEIVPGATHLFEEPGTLDQVAALARAWFQARL